MDDEAVKRQFEQIATGAMAGEMMTAIHSMYAGAITAGFPEERAWDITVLMIDKIIGIMGPDLAKILKG